MAKRGRKPKYKEGESIKINKTLFAKRNSELNFIDKNVFAILQTKVKKMTGSSGAHITLSQDYDKHKAYVIVMEEKI